MQNLKFRAKNAFQNWERRAKLEIESSYVDAVLTDWPVLIDESVLPAGFFSTVLNGGGDIRVSSDAAGFNRLSLEVVLCDTGTSKAELWVKVPSISSTINTPIYLWYGKAGETQPAAAASYGKYSVWDTSVFMAVYHMQANGNDSTSNQNNPSASTAAFSAGKIQNAAYADGSQYIDYNNAWPANVDARVNFSYWLYPNGILPAGGTLSAISETTSGGTNQLRLSLLSGTSGHSTSILNSAPSVFTSSWNLTDSAWNHVSVNYDSIAKSLDQYKNYAAASNHAYTTSPSVNWNRTRKTMFSTYSFTTWAYQWFLDGGLDEVRYIRRNLTAAERKWDYNNQYDVSNTISLIY